jgi:hypothetical protein
MTSRRDGVATVAIVANTGHGDDRIDRLHSANGRATRGWHSRCFSSGHRGAHMPTSKDNPAAGVDARTHVRRISQIVAKAPYVMLVRIEPGEEPPELGLREAHVHLLRVRHPLPARQRMRILRPLVVVCGPRVRGVDSVLLAETAGEIRAAILQLGPFVRHGALRGWLQGAIEEARRRRRESADQDLPYVRVDGWGDR